MHGNLDEWCQDGWHDNYEGAPANGSAWDGGAGASKRVVRGGSWGDFAKRCRSAKRDWGLRIRYYDLSFRPGFSLPK